MCLSAALALIVLQLCVYGNEGAGVEIGQLPTLQHGVRGTLYALDETTFFIEDFEYDGQGPATYVYVFRRGQPVLATGGGIVIDWSNMGDGRITSRYTGSDVTISLTNQAGGDIGLTVEDIGTFTIWCEFASVFFTRIEIPSGLMLGPGSLPTDYCAELTENFQVSWAANDTTNMGVFELCGCIEENQYLAFGISGSNTRTDMIGADVIVVWLSNGQPNAVDYLLTARQQCRSGNGVCPDTMVTGGSGTNDVFNVTGRVTNGLTCVKYLRMLNTGDSAHDLTILANQSQFIAWAIGPRATEAGLGNLAFFHTEYPRNGANVEINFGEDPTGDMVCQAPPQCIGEDLCGWTGMTITAREERTFRVKIGPSGGLRGYEYITGLSGWGIAFYIDGKLAPLLRLRRNVTYTFIVEAGDDPNDAPNYHPFYITNSQDGGILLNQGMRNNEVVYAGYDTTNNTATAAGRHCQYVETSASASVATSCDSTLQQYINTLNLSCQGDQSDAATLTWTPDENTPNTIYYQCANHLHLGWKIEFDSARTGGSSHGVDTTSPIKLLKMLPIVLAVFTIMDYVL